MWTIFESKKDVCVRVYYSQARVIPYIRPQVVFVIFFVNSWRGLGTRYVSYDQRWPTANDFNSQRAEGELDGLRLLRYDVQRTEGVAYWADLFSVSVDCKCVYKWPSLAKRGSLQSVLSTRSHPA